LTKQWRFFILAKAYDPPALSGRAFYYLHMQQKKVYLTEEGLAELKAEHKELTEKRRPELVIRVSDARNQGDLSENAEYVAAREELSFIDGRIGELEDIIRQAEIIEEKLKTSGAVSLGSKVTLTVGQKKDDYMVVGAWEADPASKKISHESPLGQALIGKGVGDEVEVEAPAGKIRYTIIAVA
jgi:transcription elongation factor GreA